MFLIHNRNYYYLILILIMRYSHQREIIREIVFSTNSHPSADWIYGEVKRSIPNISLGTVYRNLKQLTDEGIIRTIYDGALARYDWNRDPHDHMKCTVCGEMIDIQLSNDGLRRTIKNEYDFEVSDVEITLVGKCNKHA